MAKLDKFKNESRLLSDDEQELIKVLASFYDALEDSRARIKALEDMVETIVKTMGTSMLVVGKRSD